MSAEDVLPVEPARAGMRVVLLDGASRVELQDVRSLVAQDASGQFGLMAGHAAFLTVLEPGLFRYRTGQDEAWRFGASAGGLLRCEPVANATQGTRATRTAGQGEAQGSARPAPATEVKLVSRRFLLGEQPETLQTQLDHLLAEEQALRMSTRDNMEQLDLALMKRMQELAQQGT